jgi:hypothetical protein
MQLTPLGKALAGLYGGALLLVVVWFWGIPEWTYGIVGNLLVIAGAWVVAKIMTAWKAWRQDRRITRLVNGRR